MSTRRRRTVAISLAATFALAVPGASPASVALAEQAGIPDPAGADTLPDLRAYAPIPDGVGDADLPDVVSDPGAWADRILDPNAPRAKAIRLHSTFANDGPYSFEVVGVPTGSGVTDPEPGTMEALQCERWEGPEVNGAQRTCARYAPVGTMSWDPHHFHVHLEDFTRFALTEIEADGTPGPVVVEGEKLGFCMIDNIPWSPTIRDDRPPTWLPSFPGALDLWWFARHGWYKGCSQPPMPGAMYRQGVSPGWTDTYYSPYPGQQLVIEDPATGFSVPDGEYLVVFDVNPTGRFLERDRSDNRAWARIRLFTENGERELERLGSYAPPAPTG